MSQATLTLEQQLAAALAENQALKANASNETHRGLTLKVSTKGAVSIYGVGRFPVTLYSSQMLKVLDQAEEIRAFMIKNAAMLHVKPAKAQA